MSCRPPQCRVPCKPCSSGPCGGCKPCEGCGPCGGCCCCQQPCAVISYELTSGPIGPVLPCMQCLCCNGGCTCSCAPPFYYVPNRCGCCYEWGCFGPFY